MGQGQQIFYLEAGSRNNPTKKTSSALHLSSLHIVAICTSKAPQP